MRDMANNNSCCRPTFTRLPTSNWTKLLQKYIAFIEFDLSMMVLKLKKFFSRLIVLHSIGSNRVQSAELQIDSRDDQWIDDNSAMKCEETWTCAWNWRHFKNLKQLSWLRLSSKRSSFSVWWHGMATDAIIPPFDMIEGTFFSRLFWHKKCVYIRCGI